MITRGREPDQSSLDFTLGSSRKVRLREAEGELNRLWETAADEARARGREGVMRLREVNLLVYARGEPVAGRVSTVITWLAERHPARVIVLLELAGDEPEGELEAWVTAACYLGSEGSRNVCWEQVTVPARGENVAALQIAANSLLVPDLPTILWWPGTPDFDGVNFERLSAKSDLVVVDSAGFADPLDDLGSLARLVYDGSRDFGVADLNWARVTPWREMIAQLFDEPDRLRLLPEFRRVVISYGAEDVYETDDRVYGPAVVRALLLAAWLATRLGWASQGEGWRRTDDAYATTMGMRHQEGTVELVLERRELGPSAVGGLLGISIETQLRGEDSGPSFMFIRTPETCVCAANVREQGEETLIRTFDLSVASESRLLSEELDFLERDEVYEEAMIMAASLASMPGGTGLGG